jgi:hypothetical protein
MKGIIIAALLTCLVTPALGRDKQGNYTVLGEGTVSCGKWLKYRQAKSVVASNYVAAWIAGYLSAHNKLLVGVKNIGKDTDTAGRYAWIDNYCRANPLSDIDAAADALIAHLKSR